MEMKVIKINVRGRWALLSRVPTMNNLWQVFLNDVTRVSKNIQRLKILTVSYKTSKCLEAINKCAGPKQLSFKTRLLRRRTKPSIESLTSTNLIILTTKVVVAPILQVVAKIPSLTIKWKYNNIVRNRNLLRRWLKTILPKKVSETN